MEREVEREVERESVHSDSDGDACEEHARANCDRSEIMGFHAIEHRADHTQFVVLGLRQCAVSCGADA